MMLILSVILICSYLYPVCLVSRALKNTYFKEHLLVFASKYRNLHYDQCLNIAPMVYDPNEKGIMASMEYTIMSYSPNGKGANLLYQVVILMVKDKNRCTIKDTMSIKIIFMHYRN